MAEHSSMQADVVLEKELRMEKEVHLDSTGNRKSSETLGMAYTYMKPQALPPQ